MIGTAIVGFGLAGRHFHTPLILRQPGLKLRGVVARDPKLREEAVVLLPGIVGYSELQGALDDPEVDLVVIATPHDTHADLASRTLEAGKHCVVDKVMALSEREADRMIAARDASEKMLSVFHNRRWDWDFLTLKSVLASGSIGRPLLIESSVCRHAPPRTWRGASAAAGTIMHDWGAHLIDHALQLNLGPVRRVAAWITPAPWPGVDSGGHGRIVLEFDDVLFQVEASRVCRIDRPRWWVVGTKGGFVKHGIDPQEDALRGGYFDAPVEPPGHKATVRSEAADGSVAETVIETLRGSWDSYFANVVDHLERGASLAVTAEEAREVVRVLDAAVRSSQDHAVVEGRWGYPSR